MRSCFFSVQLLLGKYFLPWFGGTPAMWTTGINILDTQRRGWYGHMPEYRERSEQISVCGLP